MTTKFPDLLRISSPIEFKRASDAADGTVQGYASTFGGEPDSYGDVIAPGAFTASLARHKAEGTAPLMLWGHDSDRPIGRWTEFAQDEIGLPVKGGFNLDTVAGRDARAHVKAGDLGGLSIGYVIEPGGSKPGPHGTRILTALDLKEISIVGFPANRRARVTGVKSFGSRAELESILREHLPARAVKKLLSGGWPAMSADDDEPEASPAIVELLKSVKAARLELEKDFPR